LEIPDAAEVTKYFNDITADRLYADYIAATGKEGIFTGDANKNFAPKELLTRQQMATTLVNAFNLQEQEEHVDVNLANVSETHKKNVQVLADLGITSQLKDFRPKEAVTRGQFATFLKLSSEAAKEMDKEVAVESATAIDNYTIEVVLKGKVDKVSAEDFEFDNGLKVLDAEVKKDETANNGEKNTTVVLSTTNLKHGITYNLIRFKRSSVSVEVISAEDEKDQGSNVPAPNPPKNQVHKGNIEEITDDNLTIDGKTYKVADSLNGFFQASNNEALQDAKIEIVSKNRVIQKVNGLTLNNSGTADKNLVIDGNDTIIDGPVTVNGDYYQINHLTVNGDLTLEEGVQNSFISDHLEVKGTTRAVDSSTIQSFSDSANFFTTASERENPKSRLTIVFKDSTMATIE